MEDFTGRQFGDYYLTRFLGKGSFGHVYLGEHVYLKTEAAVKVLRMRLHDQNDLKTFIKEARTFRLKHPHIIQLLDFGIQDEDIPYLVMEYAPLGTLRQLYPQGTQLPIAIVVEYVNQIADGLQYAHNQRIIHRDVKPENILLSADNTVLLSDFGIAAVAHSTKSWKTEDAIGTVAYMAPEQLLKKPHIASDQYALAVIVYEWLCGTIPFLGSTIEIAIQHLTTPPPRLRTHLPSLLPAVENVVLKAMEKEPQRRFESVLEFARALERASGSIKPRTQTTTSIPKIQIIPEKSKQEWMKEGDDCSKSGHLQAAIVAYTRALDIDPRDMHGYLSRGLIFSSLKKYEHALRDYNFALALDAGCALAYYYRGSVFYELQNYRKALEDYDHAIRYNPTYAAAYKSRGMVYNDLREFRKAIEDYNRALALTPDDALLYYYRGCAYYGINDQRRATEDYDRALALNASERLRQRDSASNMLKEYWRAIEDLRSSP